MEENLKQLLLRDLCARLPYGFKANIPLIEGDKRIYTISFSEMDDFKKGYITIKPYLRPMSSMTEEEKKEYESLCILIPVNYDSDLSKYDYYTTDSIDSFDWLNAHHFDYRGLIENGLALEAPKEMYNIKEE